MKKLAALLLVLVMLATTLLPAWAEEGDSAGDSAGAPTEEAAPAEGDSEGDSAGDSAGEPAEEAAPAEGDSEGDSAGEPAEEEAAPAEEEASADEPAPAEEAAPAEEIERDVPENFFERSHFTNYDEMNAVIRIIPADGEQVELGYLEGITAILYKDNGLAFKDLNGNGEIDPYEDWQLPVDERIRDLYDQMDIYEKSGLFYHTNTANSPSGDDFSIEENMFGKVSEFVELGLMEEPEAEPEEEEEEAEESESGGGGMATDSMWYCIEVLKVTSQLDNTNGTPDQQVDYHNGMQALAEETRLGVPVVISNDREYNAWGGMIDAAHAAFGAANDLDLAKELWTIYSLESRATGIHLVLHPYGQELGSWNGEDPEYIGTMTREEVLSLQVEGGVEACMKHFIARGGDSSFQDARSEAQTVDNWMTAWRIALEAKPKWIMTNGYGTGLSNTVHVDYDKETLDYLRKTLGFEGIIVSDWGDEGDNNSAGVTTDGVTILDLTIPERYAWVINLGMDQIGCFGTGFDEDGHGGTSNRWAIIDAILQDLISEERVYETCYRVLKDKFELGLFENPYSDPQKAMALACSEAYIAEQFPVTNNDELTAARNPYVVELERQLQAKSTVLIKNDDNLLPLEKGIKLFIESNVSTAALEGYKAVLPEFCELVDEVEDADVVVVDASSFNDAVDVIIEDARDAGKKVVLIANHAEKDSGLTTAMNYCIENGDAALLLTFSRAPDHGVSTGTFITTTEPIVLAELLFGVREPEGMIVKEVGRTALDNDTQWKDLAGDKGVDNYVRLMLLGTMESSENNVTPNNWGDPLLQYKYGMRYGAEPVFTYEALILPKVSKEIETEGSSGVTVSVQTVIEAKAGEPFTVSFLMWNKGDDGITTVQALVDGEVNAKKVMAINGGDWRVVQMELCISEPGEHEITIGDMTKTLNIAE